MNKPLSHDHIEVGSPYIERVRHDLKRRNLRVEKSQYLTPHMIRVTSSGGALDDFTSLSPDDHIKVFLPETNARRDYTPRYFDQEKQQLTLDFAVHEAGPATAWALQAKVGDELEIAGPKGSQLIHGDIRHWILIGDTSALPAIGRRIEGMTSKDKVTAIVIIPDEADQQQFLTEADLTIHWITPTIVVSDAQQVMNQLADVDLGDKTFVWLAGEHLLIMTLRHFLQYEKGHSKSWMKAAAYWKKGTAEGSHPIE